MTTNGKPEFGFYIEYFTTDTCLYRRDGFKDISECYKVMSEDRQKFYDVGIDVTGWWIVDY